MPRPRRLTVAAVVVAVGTACAGAPPAGQGSPVPATSSSASAPSTTPTSPPPAATEQVTWRRGIAYGDDPAQVVDVALPPESVPSPTGQSDARPTILFVHGGGWTEGRRGVYDALAEVLARDGWVAVTVGYRLAPGTTYPGPVDDVRQALAYVLEHRPELPVDPDRVVLAGDSAGGHLTGLVALSDTAPEVAAWVSWSGVYDLADVASTTEGTRRDWLTERISAHLGCDDPTAGACRDAAQTASPVRLADAGDPPTLLLHSRDELVPLADARAMRDALADAGVRVRLEVVDGGQHGLALLEETSAVVSDFLRDVLDLNAATAAP